LFARVIDIRPDIGDIWKWWYLGFVLAAENQS
jgi:hypothetical protein